MPPNYEHFYEMLDLMKAFNKYYVPKNIELTLSNQNATGEKRNDSS
jgi:hypothetical protein